MIATGILHGASWHFNVLAWFIGFLILGMTALSVLLVTGALRPRQGPLLERSLFAFGPATLGPMLLFLLLRLFERVEPAFGPGPQYWLLDWIPSMAGQWVHPYDTLVALHTVSAASAGAIALFAALIFPPKSALENQAPLPGRLGVAVPLLLCALLVPFLAFRVYVEDIDSARLLDCLAMIPTLALCVSLRAFARLYPPPEKAIRAARSEEPNERADFRGAWARRGLLNPEDAALVEVSGHHSGGEPTNRAAAAWAAAEGPGSPPACLDELLENLPGSKDLHVLGDLPAETEHRLMVAALADLVGARGMRILMVAEHVEGIQADLHTALRRARTWEPGAVVIGPDALQESISGDRMPALALVRPTDLGSRLIKLAVGGARGWATGLDLIIVHRPDVGDPVDVTHTAFLWRRWHLAMDQLTCPPVLVTSPSTPAHRAFLEQLFPGRNSVRVAYEARTASASRAWPGREPEPESGIAWLARAATAVTELGEEVSAVDPTAQVGKDVLGTGTTLSRAIRWPHEASVAIFDPPSLVEAVGSLPNRLPATDAHDSLWLLPGDPVSRFLHPSRLKSLSGSGRLPRPAPVIGMRNRFLRLAHLDAALREAPNDERSLRTAFGDDLVDFRLRTTTDPIVRSANHSAWRHGSDVIRSPHLQAPSAGGTEVRTDTVTNDTVDVVEQRTGDVLMRVDARTATTRFYPKRVFGRGARRYRVPMHAFDSKRRKLSVVLASPRDRATRPVMSFHLELRRTTVERVTRRHGRFTMHTLAADVLVTERVHAAWVPETDQEERFDAVESQFDTEARFILPDRAEKGLALFHLAATVEAVLPIFLRCDNREDCAVTPVRAGFLPGMGAGIAIVDRFVGGMGFASALDDGALAEILTWTRAMLYECECMEGCEKCSPAAVLRVGADKQGVLKMLDGL